MTLKAKKLPIPGLLWGMYPEKKAEPRSSNAFKYIKLIPNCFTHFEKIRFNRLIKKIRLLEKQVTPFDSSEYKLEIKSIQIALRHDGFTESNVAKAFVLINQAFLSTMQIELFDTQMMAAFHMLNNRLTEMATGEGKTYAVALASATAALSGVPVHVVTANDYLAERDARSIEALYKSLGLTVDAATHGQKAERRKQAYACDITYCTAKELVFDYLRDTVQRKKHPTIWHTESADNTTSLLLRGLCMAIIDEADSILLDEARMPLILSRSVTNEQESKYYLQSFSLACQFLADEDFILNKESMQAALTDQGRIKLEKAAYQLPAVWRNKLHREEAICQAIAAINLYHRDQHYIVEDEKIHIIDETSGRIAAGRAWSRGLHQLIELKENCNPSDSLSTISQVTYQRFFPRYFHLCGVSGTLLESRSELFHTYGLHVSKVPLRTPCQRKVFETKLFENQTVLNNALVNRITALISKNRPVIIGTESVSGSELLSSKLNEAGINHTLLNAKNHENEAQLIARAGLAGAVTITTNMAGRGTDIKLDENISNLGGLHVISCQVNASRRVDRQLVGRSARQGNLGSTETWVSLDSTLLQERLPVWILSIVRKHAQRLPSYLVEALIRIPQWNEQQYQSILRRRLLQSDNALEKNLSFGEANV